MKAGTIEGFTRELGKPIDWDDEKQGKCDSLPIRDEMTVAGPCMISEWIPTEEEIEMIKKGHAVHLCVFGMGHPPVYVGVNPVPKET